MKAVDSHAHVFTRALRPVAGARYVPAYDAVLGDWLALQDASGITHGVLVQPSFLGTDNTFLLEALRACPARLRGTVVVEPGLPAATVGAWDASGVRGVRLNVVRMPDLPDVSAPGWRALFARIADYGWHVEVHASGVQLAGMLRMLEGCPAALVFDHFALPDPALGTACPVVRSILRLSERQAVYVKLSAPYRLGGGDAAQYARFWLQRLGAGHLLWGSDWPWTNHEGATTYAACVAQLSGWVPDPADRRRILWDTASSLFRFSGEDGPCR